MGKKRRESTDYFIMTNSCGNISNISRFNTFEEAMCNVGSSVFNVIMHVEEYRYYDENGVIEKEEIIKQRVSSL